MSRIRFMSTAASGETHVVSGKPRLTLPFRYTDSAAGTGDLTPFAVTFDQLEEWWWRFQTLRLEFQLSTPSLAPFTAIPASPIFITLSRYVNNVTPAGDEVDLIGPGADCTEPGTAADTFSGSHIDANWNGTGGNLEVQVKIGLCSRQEPPVNAIHTVDVSADSITTRAWFRTDLQLLKPTLWISVVISVTTPGVEFACDLLSFPTDRAADFTPDAANDLVFDGYGGGSIGLDGHDFDGVGIDSDTICRVTPYTWYPYAKADTSAQVWNTTTGAALLDPRQDPI